MNKIDNKAILEFMNRWFASYPDSVKEEEAVEELKVVEQVSVKKTS